MKIAVVAGLSDKKLLSKIKPLLDNEKVEKLYLYRNTSLSHDKIVNRVPKGNSSKIFFELQRIITLLRDSFRVDFDVYIGVYVFLHGIIAWIVSKMRRRPVIQVLPGSDVDYIISKKRFLFVLKTSKFLITRGSITNKELLSLGIKEEHLQVIPNYFDFQNISSQKMGDKKDYDLITISNLIESKRIDLLLEITDKLVSEHSLTTLKVAIIGDGPLFHELQVVCKKRGLEPNVDFLGHQQNVDDFLKRSRLFIMTTEIEGLPQVLIEALAAGVPCIMPKINNIPDVAIDNYNSLLVEVLNLEDYVDAICKLQNNSNLFEKLQEGALNFRKEHEYEYSAENITNLWGAILTKCEGN